MIVIEGSRIVRHLLCFAALALAPLAHAATAIPIIRPTQTILHPPIPPGTSLIRTARGATDGITAMVTGSTERVVDVYRRDESGDWSSLARLPIPGFVPSFENSSVNLAVDGDLAVITEQANISGPQAYVYGYIDGAWQHVQTLADPAGTPVFFGAFGAVLAIKRDVIVITDEARSPGGAVYIYTRASDGAFVLSQTIQGASEFEGLGSDAAIHDATLLVGARSVNAAYVFQEIGTTWVQHQKLVPARDETGFGRRVALSDEVLAVAADSRLSMRRRGSITVYVPRGPRWKRQQILDDPDPPGGSFAFTIAVTGSQLLAQAFHTGAEPWVTRILLFERTRGKWRPTALLIGNEGDPTTNWGETIAAARGTVVTTTLASPARPDGAPPVLGRTHFLQLP